MNTATLLHNEIDLYITNQGFYLAPTLPEEQFSIDPIINHNLFSTNLQNINRRSDSPINSEDSGLDTKSKFHLDTFSHISTTPSESKDSHQNNEIPIPTILPSPTLSSSSYQDNQRKEPSKSIPIPGLNHHTSFDSTRKFLQISFDRKPPCEIDEFTPVEPYRRYRIYGIVGCLRLLTGWHLVVIRQRRQVGIVKGHPLYQITETQLLPFDYTLSILALDEETKNNMEKPSSNLGGELISTPSDLNLFERLKIAVQTSSQDPDYKPFFKNGLNLELAQFGSPDVTEVAPSPADFKAWVTESTPMLPASGTSVGSSTLGDESPQLPEDASIKIASRKVSQSQDELLEARVKKEIIRLFSTEGNMYVSYGFDITNNLQSQSQSDATPMWQKAQPWFFWNYSLQTDFMTSGLDEWVLPVMQGYIQSELCQIGNNQLSLTLISRQDTRRLGIRYQRRGVNELGHVANFVETEQIVEMVQPSHQIKLCSFLQVRGSIPLFWSQSPYSLKPVPILERGGDNNLEAITKHLLAISTTYGPNVYLINLTEQNGRENLVGSTYNSYTNAALKKAPTALNQVKFLDFDYNKETQESNDPSLDSLFKKLGDGIDNIGYYLEGDGAVPLKTQQGVFRTNCMDCLNRTNKVQSSVAQHVLELQLQHLRIKEFLDSNLAYRQALETTLQQMWVQHGEALSLAHAGAAAAQPDATRMGDRNFGVVNDAADSLARFYFNAFQDFFTQAVLDYLQGHHHLEKFREVAETHVATEPGLEDYLGRVRMAAVKTSAALVLLEGETLLGGWVMLSPLRIARLYHNKLEEKVILLTPQSVYLCSFHFGLEKVIGFTRIPLERVDKLQVGRYILTLKDLRDAESPPDGRPPTSSASLASYGVVIHYRWDIAIDRRNTRSLKSRNNPARVMKAFSKSISCGSSYDFGPELTMDGGDKSGSCKTISRFVALKGLPTLSTDGDDGSLLPFMDLHSTAQYETYFPFRASQWEGKFNRNPTQSTLPSVTRPHPLSPHQAVQQFVTQLQKAYHARLDQLDASSDPPTLEVIERTILSTDSLRNHLYPPTSSFILSPQRMMTKIIPSTPTTST